MVSGIQFIAKSKQDILVRLHFKSESEKNQFIRWLAEFEPSLAYSTTYLRIEITLLQMHVRQFLDDLAESGEIDAADVEKYIPILESSTRVDRVDNPLFKRRRKTSSESLSSIPTPPPAPHLASKGYLSPGYWQLLNSLVEDERSAILDELKQPDIIARADQLEIALKNNQYQGNDFTEMRPLFLAALLCLQRNTISINQLATMHLLDSAIRTLYSSPMFYMHHDFTDTEGRVQRKVSYAPVPIPTEMSSFYKLNYTTASNVDSNHLEALPEELKQPLMMRFFNFNTLEWAFFCEEMRKATPSEQSFYALNAPESGCWSAILFNIQKLIKCFRVLEWAAAAQGGPYVESIMLVPSFTMLQIAINAKAKTLSRRPVQLLPTYGYLEETAYARYKSVGVVPMCMYLPERFPLLQYNDTHGGFRNTVDSFPAETHFAGALHDVYHAFRELLMTESVCEARMRLAFIALHHPLDQMSPEHFPISQIIIDGELLINYPKQVDTIFDPKHRLSTTEIFGDLFERDNIKPNLHPDLKRAFIEDMVIHQDEWRESFNLGREDLRPLEQSLYDVIAFRLQTPTTSPMF